MGLYALTCSASFAKVARAEASISGGGEAKSSKGVWETQISLIVTCESLLGLCD